MNAQWTFATISMNVKKIAVPIARNLWNSVALGLKEVSRDFNWFWKCVEKGKKICRHSGWLLSCTHISLLLNCLPKEVVGVTISYQYIYRGLWAEDFLKRPRKCWSKTLATKQRGFLLEPPPCSITRGQALGQQSPCSGPGGEWSGVFYHETPRDVLLLLWCVMSPAAAWPLKTA